MNITLFIDSLYGGGAERVVCNLANYLSEKGHSTEILTMSETGSSYPLSAAVRVTHLIRAAEAPKSPVKMALRITRLSRYLLSHRKTDAYIVMLPRTSIFLLSLRMLTRAKIILSERADPAQYSPKIQRLLKKIAPKADGFVFQTADARSWYSECIDEIPAQVIPNAINPAFLRPMHEGERVKEITAAGRLNNQKRFDLLIQAFSDIAEEFPDYSLTIYGEGFNREKFEALARESGFGDRIHLPGNVSDIADRLSPASLFVLSSDFEGMPNALMEAMALGLPCISTDCPVGGPRFLIQQGSNGVLVPVGDRKALADAMRLVLSDRELADKMGANAAEIQKRLSPDIVYSQWEGFIRSCITE